MTNSLRATYLRHKFFFDQRLNQTPPSALGFGYPSSNEIGAGPAVLQRQRLHADRRRDHRPAQHDAEHLRDAGQRVVDARLAPDQGRRRVPAHRHRHVPGDRAERVLRVRRHLPDQQRRRQPAARRAGDVLPGPRRLQPRHPRLGRSALYAQDEWRRQPHADAELRPALRAHQPVHRGRGSAERVRARRAVAGAARRAARACSSPATPASARASRRAPTPSCRASALAWDPDGTGTWSVRASYGLFYDQFQNGSGTASQVAISALPAAQFNQFSGAGPELPEPVSRAAPYPQPDTFVRPSTVFALDVDAKPPYVAELERGRAALAVRPLPRRGALRRRHGHAPAAQRRSEPGGLRSGRHGAERRPPPPLRQLPGRRRHLRLLDHRDAAQHHELVVPRRPGQPVAALRRRGVGFNVSYWFSKSIDYLSAMNLSGAAAKPLAGENDLAQNPFDLEAEYGPSLFDARHRFVASASWEPHVSDRRAGGRARALRRLAVERASPRTTPGTPFTVSDSANVALQANSPPISGFPASRPNVVGDPNAGPHTVDEWISRSAFQRLNLQTQAGQFGNAGRNIARGPAYTNVDVSLVRDFALRRADTRLQFRAEVFNVAQPRQLRPAGGRPQLGQLRPHPLGRPAAPDAVRAEADLLDARAPAHGIPSSDGMTHARRSHSRATDRARARATRAGASPPRRRRRVRQLRVAARLHVRHLPQAAGRGVLAGRARRSRRRSASPR